MVQWLGLIGVGFGLATAIVAALYVGRSKAKDETIEAQQSTIEALTTRITSLHDSALEETTRCEEKIAELRGKVDALSIQQSEAIAGVMAPQVVRGLVQALESGEWGQQR